ncbi:hypothetical protein VSVS12_04537 (plasmid) [Vibrio scophthalmi]|nr:hypothetical protein VSVS12_04537 [Vibrio scophthalmi]
MILGSDIWLFFPLVCAIGTCFTQKKTLRTFAWRHIIKCIYTRAYRTTCFTQYCHYSRYGLPNTDMGLEQTNQTSVLYRARNYPYLVRNVVFALNPWI